MKMNEQVYIDFYKIKRIKNYQQYNNMHTFIVINEDNSEKFLCLKEKDFINFWGLYCKVK